MAIVAGIDEAGYGPLLGPLVVSAAAFRVPDRNASADFWEYFSQGVSRHARGSRGRVRVADSKAICRGKTKLRALEKNILPFVWLLGTQPGKLSALMALLGGPEKAALSAYPWYRDRDPELPVRADANDVTARADALRAALAEADGELCGLRICPVGVAAFNSEVAASDNKSVPPARRVGALMANLWQRFGKENLGVAVDKQGGRNRYGALLAATFPSCRIGTVRESRESSEYVVEDGTRRMHVSFSVKADDLHLATALASMLSKYVRELFVGMLNDYWMRRVPGLKPTAGYVQDGRRFLAEIESARLEENIPPALLVRCR